MTKPRKHLEALLIKGLEELSLPFTQKQIQQWLDYLFLLNRWNQVYNLTAINDLEHMVSKHLLDSLAIAPWVQGERLLDVGSGAGLPGIPLAILYANQSMDLLDSQQKRIIFLNQAITTLELPKEKTIHSRVESYHSPQLYDTILARAFGSLAMIWENTRHLLKDSGTVLAMKGLDPKEEIQALPPEVKVENIAISVPLLNSQRHMVRLRHQGE